MNKFVSFDLKFCHYPFLQSFGFSAENRNKGDGFSGHHEKFIKHSTDNIIMSVFSFIIFVT